MLKIPIEEYEQDIDTKLSKEKKKEILDLFTNSNKLFSEVELNEIEERLHKACKESDINLIKIYLSKTIQNNCNDLSFKIGETTKTASLFKVSNRISQLIVPRTVHHESTEYLITSITGTRYDVQTIKFVEDSAVSTIYFGAISESDVEKIYFPASLRELKEGWCMGTNKLTKITISPSNNQFMMKDDKYLLGKTDPNCNEFDKLLFAVRDIKEISIPSNIKIISSFAFYSCKYLTKFEIQPNSNLQAIGSLAFYGSTIKEVFIPSNVSKICDEAFSHCENLTKVEIPPNSNLQTIEHYAFAWSNIKEVFIASKVSKICENAFSYCTNLEIVEISEKSELESIPLSAFYLCPSVIFMIPSSIQKLIQTNESK